MAQQKIGQNGVGSDSAAPATGADPDSYSHIKYLDVSRLKYIKGLAMTLDSVAEVEMYLEAEKKRWGRDSVMRVLQARKNTLTDGPK